MVRVFANGPGNLGSIPGRVIPKTQKILDTSLLTLSIIRYVSRVKWSIPGKGVAPSLQLGVEAIKKGAFRSPSDNGRQLYFYFILLLESVGKTLCIRFFIAIS